MKKLLLLLFSILISFNSYADYNSGFSAYEKGEYSKALREWRPLAEAGNVNAQAMLGVMYLDGHGIPKNEEISAKWFKLAAEQGDSVSQNYIGLAYEWGLGVEQNYKNALKWYRLSAEKKNRYTDDQIQIDSLFYLGNMYKNGYGVPVNSIFAYMWFNIAASLGDKESSQIRDKLETNLDSNEISLAKKLARKCESLNYKCTSLYEDINVKKVVKNDTKSLEATSSSKIDEEELKENKKSEVEEAEVQRILLILKKQEEKRKAEEAKRIFDAKKIEEKRKAEEAKRIFDAKKAEEKIAEEKRKILDKKIEEEERKAEEAKRIFDAKKIEEKRILEENRIAQEKLNLKLSLLPPLTELQKAQNFLSDIQVFIANHPDEFDFFEIVKFTQNTTLLSDGVLNDRQLKNIELFKEIVKSSSIFLEFQKNTQNERVTNELIKLDILIDQVNSTFNKLKLFSNDNLSSTSTYLLDEKIKSSQLIIDNPKTINELESAKKDFESFLIVLRIDVQKTLATRSENKKIQNSLNSEMKKIDENIRNLKMYYLENSLTLSINLTNLILEKITLLQNVKEDISLDNREALIELLKVNKEISSFRLDNHLLTSDEFSIINKQAEKKKKVDAKKIEEKNKAEEKNKVAERKRKADVKEAERLRNFKTVNMNCYYSVNGQYLFYSWTYDGKKLYWEGTPIKIGTTSVDEIITIKVMKLSGKDKFHININTEFLTYNFENDFYNQDSLINFLGMKAFGSCY